MTIVQSAKSQQRATIRSLISLKSAHDLKQAGAFAAEQFACWYEQLLGHSFKCVGLFKSMKDEISTDGLLSFLATKNVMCSFPVQKADSLEYFYLPAGECCPLSTLDLIIVPGRAFDREGNRLGRGMAYYDRILAPLLWAKKRPLFMGMALKEQIVTRVPSEPHDIKMDFLLTDEMCISTGNHKP